MQLDRTVRRCLVRSQRGPRLRQPRHICRSATPSWSRPRTVPTTTVTTTCNSTPVVDDCNDRAPRSTLTTVSRRLPSTRSTAAATGLTSTCSPRRQPGPAPASTAQSLIPSTRRGRLDATIGAVGRRLRALPAPDQLGHRSILYRAQLQRIQRDAVQARARLATGTYGVCIDCTSPISLATLSEKPWTPVCIYCALDI